MLTLWCWTKYPEGCRFAGIGASGDEKPVEFGNKQRSSCAGYRRDVCRAAGGSLCRERIHVSVAAAEVHALALRIEEDIVGITTRTHGCNGAAVAHGEHAKLRGIPKRYKNSSGTFIQSHRKIAAVVDRPAHCLFASKTVDDRDLARLRHVHEDATV